MEIARRKQTRRRIVRAEAYEARLCMLTKMMERAGKRGRSLSSDRSIHKSNGWSSRPLSRRCVKKIGVNSIRYYRNIGNTESLAPKIR